MNIFDKGLAYINRSSDLTQSMVNEYKNSLIVLGDQERMYIPYINSYVGVGLEALNNIEEVIRSLRTGSIESQYTQENHNYYVNLYFSSRTEIQTSYVSNKIMFNPYDETLVVRSIIGDLLGNSYTTTKLHDPIDLWGNTFDGTKDTNGNIIPGDHLTYTIGSPSRYFSYAYIDSLVGTLYGNALTSSYSYTGHIANYSYQGLRYETIDGMFPVTFTTLNETSNTRYFSYSYVTGNKIAMVPFGKSQADLFNLNDIDIIKHKGFRIGLYYYANEQALFSTYFRGILLGTASYADSLYSPRKINGTNFDGSEDITTTYWGNAHDFVIVDYTGIHYGDTETVHGDQDIILKLPESIDMNIIGNATYATLAENSYKYLVIPTNSNKDFYLSFVDHTNSVFSYSYVSGKVKYNPYTGTITASYFTGWNKGTSDKAVELLNPRKINGTLFNGLEDIITTYWGAKRDIIIYDYDESYSYLNEDIDGSEDIELHLPENIHATLHGNADTSTYANTTYLSNLNYLQANLHTETDNSYALTFVDHINNYSYSYVNIKLKYNPSKEELTTSYMHATELFRGKLKAQDQWGTL